LEPTHWEQLAASILQHQDSDTYSAGARTRRRWSEWRRIVEVAAALSGAFAALGALAVATLAGALHLGGGPLEGGADLAVGGAAGRPPGGGGRGRLRLRPGVDPAYEAVAATPLSPVRALLVRLAAVLVANTLLAGGVDLALGGRGPRAGWLLPMTAAALLAVLVASRWSPAVGAVAGMGAWCWSWPAGRSASSR
jgi:hypothetical protein